MSHPPQQGAKRFSCDIHGISAKAGHDCRAISAKAIEVVLVHLGYSRVVTGPPEYVADKRFHLPPPFPIVLLDTAWANQEDVDVAVGAAVPSCRRSEDRHMKRLRAPKPEYLIA
jgi:hypothetical protein